jgi:thiamine phosphate synthase YjbQ (UPF0047 family)
MTTMPDGQQDPVQTSLDVRAGVQRDQQDQSVQEVVIDFLSRQIPKGVWKHDAQDGNGDAHLKVGLVGPSDTIQRIDGRLGLSCAQIIIGCDFDGPRPKRSVVVTVLSV